MQVTGCKRKPYGVTNTKGEAGVSSKQIGQGPSKKQAGTNPRSVRRASIAHLCAVRQMNNKKRHR